jgi:indolepyruvate ferredoxin oxidoreductase beta subunit
VREFNIVLAGVGGQGILLAAEILGTAALKEGLNVRVSEIHGMAQRGGAVFSTVRIGENVLAPTVLEGQADVLLGFEPLETLRNIKYASKKTLVVMSAELVPPLELAAKNTRYLDIEEIVEKIRTFAEDVIVVETARLAQHAGSRIVGNVVLIGASMATHRLPVKPESLMEALCELVPKKRVQINIKAFKLGRGSVEKRKRA